MRRLLIATVLALAAVPMAAVAAEPQISITLRPDRPHRAAHALLHIGAAAFTGQRIPSSLVLSVQRGFRFDPRSRAVICSAADARNSSCPDASRVGTGSLVVTVSGLFFPPGGQDVTVDLSAYLSVRQVRGDVAGVVLTARQSHYGITRSVTGRLVALRHGPFGYQLRFDHLPQLTPPAGFSFQPKSIDLDTGAFRRVSRKRAYALITTPRRCTGGSWRARLDLGYADGTSQSAPLTTPCRSR